mgnify:CR=1 FL=1|tara:strand:+ start:1347 stop:1799 length:453 start_codon:yes stop_codon:yes gene_type:complete
MALKGDRNELDTEVTYFMNETASRGAVVSVSTQGSGSAMDSASSVATVAAEASGSLPLGVLLNDVVNIDQTRQHLNWHKDEVQQGGKVTILTKGFVVTDQISGTPTAGQVAYVADSGKISGSQDGTAPAIGRFLSTKDADGYAKVSINLP